ncbi:LCCL domain protein [Cladophialophora carrionii]|uniref:LCCL domain protein n=1 Tax=Cladophialophora carrionii TaxID=86049 RepID=A0A1C1CJU4_9EURO|nr:LCCL domain protein [Cladophialophora carrionii]
MRNGAANLSPLPRPPQSNPQHSLRTSEHEDYPLGPMVADTALAAPSYEALLTSAGAGQYDEEEGADLVASSRGDQPLLSGRRISWRSGNRLQPSKSAFQAVLRWLNGPNPPRIYRIQSSEWLQAVCDRPLEKCCPSGGLKLCLLLLLYAIWAGMFILALPRSVAGSNDSGRPARLSCTSRLWSNSTNCGLDGADCRPFDHANFTFTCPAGCADVKILEPHYVGAQEVNYRSFVIGGPKDTGIPTTAVYRGDSFICPAAIHAGLVTNAKGGSGTLSRRGQQSDFPSISAHGVSSIGFPSNFPLSFSFGAPGPDTFSYSDSRWTYLCFSIILTSLLAIFITSPTTLFWSVFVGLFFHVAWISDPPYYHDYSDLISLAFRRFLPAAFVAHVIYKYCIHRTLYDLKAPIERTVLWLGGCWLGALNNVTFDRIPISRLTPHDLKQQPGAIAALLSIIGVLLVIAVGQAWCFRVEGRMPRYLLFYAIVAAFLVALILVPGTNLRIHHYILALILLPGTSLQTRPSLLYQGILIGLFINGIARWGFDSILQTPGQLLQDGELGSVLPQVHPPIVSGNRIRFTFEDVVASFDGISVLVNDVQRFVAFEPDDMSFNWTRLVDNEPEFFRFGYVNHLQLGGEWYADFTAPGQWLSNGTYVPGLD